MNRTHLALRALALTALAAAASGQAFVHDTVRVPQAGPANATPTENVELVDLDLDGDVDMAFADGGNAGNRQNRIWINVGGAQGGVVGWFQDETAVRAPAVLDSSRDVDFADIDGDGDADLYFANSSTVSNQSGRWWINMGGAQGGATGFFSDQTATRWSGLGVNNGTTECSSLPPQFALASGGFVDWSCDAAVADLDLDGLPDLVQSTYGIASTGRSASHVFLNDGNGVFREFNPGCAQLVNANMHDGTLALWAEGVQRNDTTDTTGQYADVAHEALAIELGDLDGDLDVDLLHGDKFSAPRVFDNRWTDGVLSIRDVTHAAATQNWAPGPGNYDQELGDLDNDGDLDLYGVNWLTLDDAQFFNDGTGFFAPGVVVPQSIERQIEADMIDHDGDGWLDVLVVSETLEDRIYANTGPGGGHLLALIVGAIPPVLASGQGADARDLDQDGDAEIVVATIFDEPDTLYVNTTQIPDTHAPTVRSLEQAPNRDQGSTPTMVRAHVYDNAAWYVTATQDVTLEYVDGSGVLVSTPMRWSGGQLFRGLIPGEVQGFVSYRVVAVDEQQNTGASNWLGFTSDCTGLVETYCTAKINSQGCAPEVFTVGTPSATVLVPFRIKAHSVINNKLGVLFYGFAPNAAPFQGGTLCVQSPHRRTGVQSSGGNAGPDDCSGEFSFDFNHHIRAGVDPNLVAGARVYAQHWYRDPQSSSTTGLSDAVTFVICP